MTSSPYAGGDSVVSFVALRKLTVAEEPVHLLERDTTRFGVEEVHYDQLTIDLASAYRE